MGSKKSYISWKIFHRWVGLIIAVFILLFCVSGIILNHRNAFADTNVSRKLLPSSYKIKDYNNGIIRGTTKIGKDSLLAYGGGGIWLTDPNLNNILDFNSGIPIGADQRTIKNVVLNSEGDIWCGSQFGIYRYTPNGWELVVLPNNSERISDITLLPDSIGIAAVTRSKLYTIDKNKAIKEYILSKPENGEKNVSLFKTIWHLHSGDLFGIVGKIVVDVIAVILIFLSLSGILIFTIPYRLRWTKRKNKVPSTPPIKTIRLFKWNFRWHNYIGYVSFVLTSIIVFTGMCLRPPLMIPFVMIKTAPLYGSTLDSDNHWNDKLRAIRWDSDSEKWLLSTSDGFFTLDDFEDIPIEIPVDKAPTVSPMGINVFFQESPGVWIIGSFSGIYRWVPSKGQCFNYYNNKLLDLTTRKHYGISDQLVSGYSTDTLVPVVFDYSKGTSLLGPMPVILEEQPMSLWNFALELHVGRCYSPFLGPISDLFVFIFGLIILLVIISGYILSRRHRKISH